MQYARIERANFTQENDAEKDILKLAHSNAHIQDLGDRERFSLVAFRGDFRNRSETPSLSFSKLKIGF